MKRTEVANSSVFITVGDWALQPSDKIVAFPAAPPPTRNWRSQQLFHFQHFSRRLGSAPARFPFHHKYPHIETCCFIISLTPSDHALKHSVTQNTTPGNSQATDSTTLQDGWNRIARSRHLCPGGYVPRTPAPQTLFTQSLTQRRTPPRHRSQRQPEAQSCLLALAKVGLGPCRGVQGPLLGGNLL